MSREEELIEQYKQIHATKRYGTTSEFQLGFLRRFLDHLPDMPRTVLDYGCGQSRLVDWVSELIGAEGFRYDPAIPGYDTLPLERADLVICTDVLEHVPEENVPGFIDRLAGLSDHVFLNVALTKAREILPNGENAHCTVKPLEWWRTILRSRFAHVVQVQSYTPSAASFVTWQINPRQRAPSVVKPNPDRPS